MNTTCGEAIYRDVVEPIQASGVMADAAAASQGVEREVAGRR
ncbi:hypothetical protein [Buchananella hordeovulneris]|nr:hypothetical protein [Buchananella hordeovulneris]